MHYYEMSLYNMCMANQLPKCNYSIFFIPQVQLVPYQGQTVYFLHFVFYGQFWGRCFVCYIRFKSWNHSHSVDSICTHYCISQNVWEIKLDSEMGYLYHNTNAYTILERHFLFTQLFHPQEVNKSVVQIEDY